MIKPSILTTAALVLLCLPSLVAGAEDHRRLGLAANARALADLTQRLEEDSRNAGLLTDYANLLVRNGRFEEARAAYESALSIAPSSITALHNLGLLQLELGEHKRAAKLFRQCLDIDPSFARGHYAMGSYYTTQRKHRRAVDHFSTAFRLDPSLTDPQHNPEVLFNSLTPWASMKAYLETPLGRGTRLYHDPQPIIGALIEELDAVAEEEPAPEVEN